MPQACLRCPQRLPWVWEWNLLLDYVLEFFTLNCRVHSPPLKPYQLENVAWVIFGVCGSFLLGTLGWKSWALGCLAALHFTLQYLGVRTWCSSSIIWVAWIVISNVCGSPPWVSGNLGRLELCRHESRCRHTASSQPAFAYFAHKQSLPTLPANNLCLLCPQTISVMIIDAPNIVKPNIQTENSGTFRKKRKSSR